MIDGELEILYSPSQWSKRYPSSDVISKHIQFAQEVSAKNKQTIPCELNIPYGTKEKQKFDLFGVDLPNDSSIFVYIHGGYWQELNKEWSSYVVRPFYENKIKTVVVGYTLCPEVSVFDIVEEIEKALLVCIQYAKNCGSKNIYISGYSAGSQLIASMLSNFLPSLPRVDRVLFKAAILCCGVYDLTPLVQTYINKPLKLDYDAAKSLSPIHQTFEPIECFVYVVVGENDSPAFKKQSQLYHDKIKTVCHDQTAFKIVEEVDHFSIVEKFSCHDYELVKFLVAMDKNKTV